MFIFMNKLLDKKWWENYWFYYKKHTIIGFFVVILIIFTAVECSHKITPDLTVSYIGSKMFDEQIVGKVKTTFSEYVDNVAGSEARDIEFMQMTLPKEIKGEQDMAMQQRVFVEIAAGSTYLYIMDKDLFENYANEGLFVDVSEILPQTGEKFGVNLNDSKIFKELTGVNKSDMYAAVRVHTSSNEKKQKYVNQQNNALKVLEKLAEK